MLVVILKTGAEITWEGRGPLPKNFDIDLVVEARADGPELFTIQSKFQGLRNVKWADLVRWFGDEAKFIAGNL